MKRLICEADIVCAHEKGCPVYVDKNTLVTPQAKDVARDLGVELMFGEPKHEACTKSEPCKKQEDTASKTHEEPVLHTACSPALTAEEIEKLTKLALERGIWSEKDLEKMLCGLGGHK